MRFDVTAADAAERVDKVIARRMPDVSRSLVQRWIAEGRVTIDSRACRARELVAAGQAVEVLPGPPPVSDAEPDEEVNLDVIYEDEHVIVVDKPAGMPVHPGPGHPKGTVVNGLLARPGFLRPPADPRDPAGRLRPGIVQRLDKGTSGALVVAKTAVARESLKTQLSEHSAERIYRAITCGVPPNGTIATLHGRHPTSRMRFTSLAERGRRAVTHVRVLEELASGRAALVECRLETGRTHQIRVHLLERTRTPILADPLYGRRVVDPLLRSAAARLGRQALHAAVLGFRHPATGRLVRFESPLPRDCGGALELLRTVSTSPPA